MDSALAAKVSIKGYLPVTMLDWEGKVATVIFTGGCDFRCPFCHNAGMVLDPDSMPDVPFKVIENYLNDKKDWIDGVVITGGEPTLQPGLEDLIKVIRNMGYPVKLDTNGTRPRVVERLLKAGLIDYAAIDIKTVFDKYDDATGVKADIEAVKESVGLILRSGLECEFRTTVYPPAVALEDLVTIARYLGEHGAKKYAIQQFKPAESLQKEARKIKPYDENVLIQAVSECEPYIHTTLR